jgi:IS1 family transposase
MACSEYQDRTLRNLSSKRIRVRECWTFSFAKATNPKPEHLGNIGNPRDIWTWAAIDADTKLIPCWTLGHRDPTTAIHFVDDLSGRLADRVQLTSDDLRLYLTAVERAFQGAVDYAQLVKLYGLVDAEGERRHSPAMCIGCEHDVRVGNPNPKHTSTGYKERANLTVRMGMRRLTRLSDGLSKKLENHAAAVSLHMMHYNFARPHMTLKTAPAVAAGVADHIWSAEEIIELLDGN